MRLSRLVQTLAIVALTASSIVGQTVAAREATPVATPAATPVASIGACAAVSEPATPIAEGEVDPTSLDLDVLYIDAIIPHHEAAIRIAREAQARSTRTEVVSLAASIVDRRTAELEQLRALRADHFPDVPALTEGQLFGGLESKLTSPGAGGVAGLTDLTSTAIRRVLVGVCDEGAEIDLAFIDATVELTSGAILLSDLAAAQAQSPEVSTFASSLGQSLQDEREQLLSWRDAWYGGVPSDHHADEPAGTPAP